MEYENKTLSDDELKHWGIIGMKWGVRRYQNKDGTLTAKGKKRYEKEMEKIKAEKKKLRAVERDKKKLSKLQAEKDSLEQMKKKATEKPGETDEQKRDRISQNPTAKDVYENRHLFSGKELSDLYNRLNTEENIKKLVPKEIDEGKARVDKAFETIGDVTEKAITASKAYNAFAAIYNAFNDPDGVDIPRIDVDNINKGNQETRRQQKKRIKEAEDREREAAEKERERAKAAKEAEKAAKAAEKQAKKEAKEKARIEKELREYEEFQKAYKKSQEASSSKSSTYRQKGGSREYTNNKERGLSVISKPKNTSSSKDTSGSTSSPSKKSKVYEGEIIWDKPVSSQTSAIKRTSSTIRWVDATVTDTPAPRSNSSTARLGQTYIAGLLPAPKDDDD